MPNVGSPFLGLSVLLSVTSDSEVDLSIWIYLVDGILQSSFVGLDATGNVAKYLVGPHVFNSVVSVGDANNLKPIVVGRRNGVEKSVETVDVGEYRT